MASRKRLPTNFFLICLVAAFFVFIAVGLPTYSGQTLFGAIFLLIALVFVGYALYKAGKRKDERRLIGAEVFEDERARVKNRAAGVTTFSLTYQDGSHELVTVRDDSEAYKTYKELGPAPR